jgi:hypothetical protein
VFVCKFFLRKYSGDFEETAADGRILGIDSATFIQAILKKLPQTEEYPELIQQPSAAQTDW